jgi:hypothetical protein
VPADPSVPLFPQPVDDPGVLRQDWPTSGALGHDRAGAFLPFVAALMLATGDPRLE